MKVGFVQLAPVLRDLQATIRTIEALIPATGPADLLVLPELCNSGYDFRSAKEAWDCSESVKDSVFIRYLESLSAKRHCHIVSGFNERDGDRLYNSAVLVGPDGYIGAYRKLHLFLNEKDLFTPGDIGLPVFDIGLCKIGITICFDWIFPEIWRILALEGADLICHPSNLVIPGLAQRAVPIHALTNRVFVITANRIGTEGELTFTGRSIIADPRGAVLIEASGASEKVGIVDIDIELARDKMMTPRNHLLADRRPEEYRRLLKR
ncbi:MAG TPA: nitrilase-related carbon-nitrogen hydrolase [Candidatus Deferrimicrobium sp.]|nr:nitrilase-related carbon-nitrogen hydrolase [Candidatus Deferrimicrobium sp.]